MAAPHRRDVAQGVDATHVERGRDSARQHAHRRGIHPVRAGALLPLQLAALAPAAALHPARGHDLGGHVVDNPLGRNGQPEAFPLAETPVGGRRVGAVPACPGRLEAPQRARMALQPHPEAAHSGTRAVDQPEELSGDRGGLPEEPEAGAAAVPAIGVDAGSGAGRAAGSRVDGRAGMAVGAAMAPEAEALAGGVEQGRVVGTERGAAVEAVVDAGRQTAPLEAALTPVSAPPHRAKPPEHRSPALEQSPP